MVTVAPSRLFWLPKVAMPTIRSVRRPPLVSTSMCWPSAKWSSLAVWRSMATSPARVGARPVAMRNGLSCDVPSQLTPSVGAPRLGSPMALPSWPISWA